VNFACADCVTNADCREAAVPNCNLVTNDCVECLNNDNCTTDALPACFQNICVECTDNDDCPLNNAVAPNDLLETCDIVNRVCVQCLTDTDCPVGGLTDLTSCLANVCVECDEDPDCTESFQSCNLGTNTCECNDALCPDNMICGAGGLCTVPVECKVTADCRTGQTCDTNVCVCASAVAGDACFDLGGTCTNG
jgi:Cys-rich repeat protein